MTSCDHVHIILWTLLGQDQNIGQRSTAEDPQRSGTQVIAAGELDIVTLRLWFGGRVVVWIEDLPAVRNAMNFAVRTGVISIELLHM